MKDLWGSRFAEPLDAALRRFSSSLPVDRRLVLYDIACSRAHAEGLRDAGLLSDDDCRVLLAGLERIEKEVDDGCFPPDPRAGSRIIRKPDADGDGAAVRGPKGAAREAGGRGGAKDACLGAGGGPAGRADRATGPSGGGGATERAIAAEAVDAGDAAEVADAGDASDADVPEDIHSAVEARLVALCGDAALRLHAGRSRNDQVATDTLLWLKEASSEVELAVRALQGALLDIAERERGTLAFAYTHLQRAQPILLAHHLLAHFEALDRDVERLREARRRADRCPLGAGACAGSTLPLDRDASARRLGFARVALNSLDAVSDRDWAIEFVGACALIMTHLSRLAEEIVLWTTAEFATARLGDAWCTGSSMMPQKRNPDVAELVRGKSARVYGDLVALHVLLKGLPLAYNRDLQEDKPPLFDAADAARESARMLAGALESAVFREPRAAGPDFSAATDLAEELVRRGVPFRSAHEQIGRLVASCEAAGRGLPEATSEDLAAAGLADLDRSLLTARGSIAAKRTLGSTSPAEVARALAEARRRLG